MTITSSDLLAALDKINLNEAFDLVRRTRNGILSTVSFGESVTPFEGYKMGWLDTDIQAQSGTLDGGVNNTATTLTLDSSAPFRVGQLISAAGSDEVMYVSAVPNGTSITVTRGFGGTTAATIADNAVLLVDSVGREENSSAADDGIYQPTNVNNFFQTMDTTISMSRRALATLQHGNTNDLNFQLNERLQQLATQMNRALVRGRKAVVGSGDGLISFAGGLNYYNDQTGAIKTNAGGGALTEAMLNNLSEEIANRGGMTNTLAVSVAKAREVSAFLQAHYSSQRLQDWQQDVQTPLILPSDLPMVGGINQVVVDTNLNDTEVVMYDRNMITIKPMAAGNASDSGDWRTVDAAAPGDDGERVRIIGDFSYEVRQSKSHLAKLHNLQA